MDEKATIERLSRMVKNSQKQERVDRLAERVHSEIVADARTMAKTRGDITPAELTALATLPRKRVTQPLVAIEEQVDCDACGHSFNVSWAPGDVAIEFQCPACDTSLLIEQVAYLVSKNICPRRESADPRRLRKLSDTEQTSIEMFP